MRKLSILLVGLMLIAGLSVGVIADDSDSHSADANITINSIALLQVNHESVNLGTLEQDDYTIDGGWQIDSLESDELTVKAFANFDYAITVEGEDTGSKSLSNTDNFKMKGADLSYSSVIGSSQELVSKDGGTNATWEDIGYKYEPNVNDEPGSYQVEVTYTLSSQ